MVWWGESSFGTSHFQYFWGDECSECHLSPPVRFPFCFPKEHLPFISPKSSAKVTLILSCVVVNELTGKPPQFELPLWEGAARFLPAPPPPLMYPVLRHTCRFV